MPEVLGVSEWLSHELQMAHPYSRTAALELVETSLVLSGRLSATLGLLAAGRIDYRRAQVLTDLLGTCTEAVAHTVEAMVLPRAPGLTPGGLAAAVRRALARVDAAALRRRHARAARAADVSYWRPRTGWRGWSPTCPAGRGGLHGCDRLLRPRPAHRRGPPPDRADPSRDAR